MGNLRILVADDHELMRWGIRELLQSQRGWRVVAEAANGVEAVEKARKLRPDVAILDIEMPELNGLKAIRQIREAAPDTHVFTLTVHESGQMMQRALEAGACGYVKKSDLATELVKAVRNVSQGKLPLRPEVSEAVVNDSLKAEAESPATKTSQVQPTSRQLQIIRLLAEGKCNKEVAAALNISVRTAETHRARIMRKFDFRSLVELVHFAIRNKIVSPPEL
jgi:DNA-binding NarL/FixJ family response regulator